MPSRCKWITAMVLLAGAAAVAGGVHAQEQFPSRPIRFLTPTSPGSVTDFLGRLVGQKMTEAWGQQIVIDNRPSAGGIVASEILLGANPDGHTLLLQANGHAANATLYRKLPYDTLRDFAGVSLIADLPDVLVVTPALGLKSVADLIALAKSKPGQMNYGSAGIGTATHINAEMFKLAAGIDAAHVPYKGTPEALNDTIAGRVQFAFLPITAVVPLVKGGKVTALAVSTRERSPALPELPTVAESGVAGFEFSLWTGMLASAKTPKPLRERIAAEVARILALPDVKERMLTVGAVPHPLATDRFDAFLRAEVEKLAVVVKASGARAD